MGHESLCFVPNVFLMLPSCRRSNAAPYPSHVCAGVVQVLQLPSQSLIKIPEHASLETFSSALSQGNAKAVVGSMLSIVADHQGVQHAPLAMLASHCRVGKDVPPQ